MPLGLSLGLMRLGGLKAALDLNLTSGFLDSRITFSRGSNATLVDATGKIVYAPANLLVYSEQFDNAAWTKDGATITANSMVAPDGTTTADTITGVSGNFRAYQAVTVANGTTYTMSAFVKQGTSPTIGLDFLNVVAGPIFTFATASWSTVGGWTTSVQALANGWYRITASYLSNTTFAGPAWRVSGTTTAFIWGAQLEPVTYQTTPSPYVATTASAYYGPRFDYDPVTLAAKGLLIEEARTNLLIQSEAFDNVAWGKAGSTISANVGVAPSGTTTADKLVEDTSTGVHEVSGTVLAITAGQNYATTFFLKADGRSLVRVMQTWNGTTDRVHADFDLSNGTVGAAVITGTAVSAGAPVITSFGNGWYRCQISGSCPTGTTLLNYVRMMSAAGVVSYTGNGTSGIFIYGAQLEAGSFATSYIPTVASTVTRSADVATMTGTNFSSWFNPVEGSFVVDYDQILSTSAQVKALFIASDGTTNNRVYGYVSGSGGPTLLVTDAGVAQANPNNAAIANGTAVKSAFAYKINDFAVVTAGGAAATDVSGTVPLTPNRLDIGCFSTGSQTNGHIRQIAYYNTRLPNSQLQTLTAPSLATTLSLSFTNQAYTVGV